MYTVTLFGLQPIYNSLTVTECRREKWEVTRVVEKEELGKLILFSDLEFMEKVGGGGFGEVWRGRWKSKKRIVAIKKFKELEKREVRQPNRPLNDCSLLQQEDSVRVIMCVMRISCLLISEYTVFHECICNLQSYCIEC